MEECEGHAGGKYLIQCALWERSRKPREKSWNFKNKVEFSRIKLKYNLETKVEFDSNFRLYPHNFDIIHKIVFQMYSWSAQWKNKPSSSQICVSHTAPILFCTFLFCSIYYETEFSWNFRDVCFNINSVAGEVGFDSSAKTGPVKKRNEREREEEEDGRRSVWSCLPGQLTGSPRWHTSAEIPLVPLQLRIQPRQRWQLNNKHTLKKSLRLPRRQDALFIKVNLLLDRKYSSSVCDIASMDWQVVANKHKGHNRK